MADSDLLEELLDTFRLEAEDLLVSLSTLLVALEQEALPEKRQPLVENLFRRMHTLKGAAHAVNLLDVAESCQSLEGVFASLKRGELHPERQLFTTLHSEINSISAALFGESHPLAGTLPAPLAAVAEPIEKGVPIEPPPEGARPKPRTEHEGAAGAGPERSWGQESVRVPTHLLEALLVQAEELLSAKLMASHLGGEIASMSGQLSALREERARGLELAHKVLRRGADAEEGRLAALLKGALEREGQLDHRIVSLTGRSDRSLRALSGMVDALLDDMKKLHLLPFGSLFSSFPKMVRDLSAELGKEAELFCHGGELEVDRRILAELREPFLHLLRNVLDHGIESPEARRRRGKPAGGRITIRVRHLDGNRAEVTLSDDGQGIDPSRLKAAAVAQETITAEQAAHLSEAETLALVFESGISTSSMITNLSGRGLGLAIVREALEKLGGHVTVASRKGEGTEFRMVLPLSFAMMKALLVQCCGRPCLLPAASVEVTARIPVEDIRTVENRETVRVEGETLSFVRLSELLELTERMDRERGQQPVVVLAAGEKRIAFAVDEVVGMLEVLTKPLGPQLRRVRNVSGACVLGDGSVVPLLNTNDLFRSALSVSGGARAAGAAPSQRKVVSVLVAEDSITSRTLLKNILEASGFRVRTAIDGSDALAILREEDFDVVVSDVEMPRLNGFELTTAIRADRRLSELPVILVTGLESREDRERGIDVGANAYIVKSSFDQSRLVETIGKLA
ncbi:response regulator [Geomonas sp. RF6]|uniref:hybrid sensor histidine kinase/response regulator n=1 Tax=Geomonas sp. RF6 TaxID=2897342 RepID=UPI001E5E7851|nr:response regulator [Geomonas sp. RF6]UFS69603.1 response regulator [Geomonas sp. RF6]